MIGGGGYDALQLGPDYRGPVMRQSGLSPLNSGNTPVGLSSVPDYDGDDEQSTLSFARNSVLYDCIRQLMAFLAVCVMCCASISLLYHSNISSLGAVKNYQGKACGKSADTADLPYLFFPLDPANGHNLKVLAQPICVSQCPNVDDVANKAFVVIKRWDTVPSEDTSVSVLSNVRSPVYATTTDQSLCLPEVPFLRAQILSHYEGGSIVGSLGRRIASTFYNAKIYLLFAFATGLFISFVNLRALRHYPSNVVKANTYLSVGLCVVLFFRQLIYSNSLIARVCSPLWILLGIMALNYARINESEINFGVEAIASLDKVMWSNATKASNWRIFGVIFVNILTLIGFCITQSSTKLSNLNQILGSSDPNGGIEIVPLIRPQSPRPLLALTASLFVCLVGFVGYHYIVAFGKYHHIHTLINYLFPVPNNNVNGMGMGVNGGPVSPRNRLFVPDTPLSLVLEDLPQVFQFAVGECLSSLAGVIEFLTLNHYSFHLDCDEDVDSVADGVGRANGGFGMTDSLFDDNDDMSIGSGKYNSGMSFNGPNLLKSLYAKVMHLTSSGSLQKFGSRVCTHSIADITTNTLQRTTATVYLTTAFDRDEEIDAYEDVRALNMHPSTSRIMQRVGSSRTAVKSIHLSSGLCAALVSFFGFTQLRNTSQLGLILVPAPIWSTVAVAIMAAMISSASIAPICEVVESGLCAVCWQLRYGAGNPRAEVRENSLGRFIHRLLSTQMPTGLGGNGYVEGYPNMGGYQRNSFIADTMPIQQNYHQNPSNPYQNITGRGYQGPNSNYSHAGSHPIRPDSYAHLPSQSLSALSNPTHYQQSFEMADIASYSTVPTVQSVNPTSQNQNHMNGQSYKQQQAMSHEGLFGHQYGYSPNGYSPSG